MRKVRVLANIGIKDTHVSQGEIVEVDDADYRLLKSYALVEDVVEESESEGETEEEETKSKKTKRR